MRKIKEETWAGDGLPDDDGEALDQFSTLGCLPDEVRAMADSCKGQAWIYEKMAKTEEGDQKEDSLTISRYYWRRTERLRALAKMMEEGDALWK